MSCNPAIGGIGKGHLVKELDALGGEMASATDQTGIQFRTLNTSKGPAVRSTRAQADKRCCTSRRSKPRSKTSRTSAVPEAVATCSSTGDRVVGVVTQMGSTFRARAVVLTTGTFLAGDPRRAAELPRRAAQAMHRRCALARACRAELPLGRLKTGTPPRLDGRTIDFSRLEVQPGDDPAPVFSFLGTREHAAARRCRAGSRTRTSARTRSFATASTARRSTPGDRRRGPRYCPSIEDKIVRFADKDRHQIFLEPEGSTTDEIYPNGISTSLPFDVQLALMRTIPGFENAQIMRPGYAIEYDFFDPRELWPRSKPSARAASSSPARSTARPATKRPRSRACSPASTRRARQRRGQPGPASRPGLPRRAGRRPDHARRAEPYRMFTSRAEYRLLLREDNADLRLTDRPRLGLVDDERWGAFARKREAIERELERLRVTYNPQIVLSPTRNAFWEKPWNESMRSLTCCDARADLCVAAHVAWRRTALVEDQQVAEQVARFDEVRGVHRPPTRRRGPATCAGNLAHQTPELDYRDVRGLSTEAQQKLNAGQAGDGRSRLPAFPA